MTISLSISRKRKNQLVVLHQVVTNQCCGLVFIFCGFISHLTINIPAIFSGVQFYGKDCKITEMWKYATR